MLQKGQLLVVVVVLDNGHSDTANTHDIRRHRLAPVPAPTCTCENLRTCETFQNLGGGEGYGGGVLAGRPMAVGVRCALSCPRFPKT